VKKKKSASLTKGLAFGTRQFWDVNYIIPSFSQSIGLEKQSAEL